MTFQATSLFTGDIKYIACAYQVVWKFTAFWNASFCCYYKACCAELWSYIWMIMSGSLYNDIIVSCCTYTFVWTGWKTMQREENRWSRNPSILVVTWNTLTWWRGWTMPCLIRWLTTPSSLFTCQADAWRGVAIGCVCMFVCPSICVYEHLCVCVCLS